MHIFVFNSNPAVDYDVNQYRRLLDSKGGSLGNLTTSESEAIERITEFTTKFYATAGRRDYWPMQTAYQTGTGIKVYSFHGLEGTLVNGPTWGESGITLTTSSHLTLPSVLGTGSPSFTLGMIYNTPVSPGTEARVLRYGETAQTEMNLYVTSTTDSNAWVGATWGNAWSVAPAVSNAWAWLSLVKSGATTYVGRLNKTHSVNRTSSNTVNLLSNTPCRIGINFAGVVSLALVQRDLIFTQSQNNALVDAFYSTLGADL